MTTCFGALDVKTTPKRGFSCYPNKSQLAASVNCHHRGERGTVGRAWQGLPQWILFNSLIRRKTYHNIVGEKIPEGVNDNVPFPLSWQGKLCHGFAKRGLIWLDRLFFFLKTVITKYSGSSWHSSGSAGFPLKASVGEVLKLIFWFGLHKCRYAWFALLYVPLIIFFYRLWLQVKISCKKIGLKSKHGRNQKCV